MPIVQLASANDDINIYNSGNGNQVLTYTTSFNARVFGHIALGDGTDDLNGSGGDFEVKMTVAGNVVQSNPLTFTVPSGDTRIILPIPDVYAPSGSAVTFTVTSPDSSDTSVDVSVYLAADLDLAGYGGVTGSVVTNVGNSTTAVYTDLSETTDDHYVGRVLIFTSGNLAHQAVAIKGYDGTDKYLTVEAMTEVAANGDTFVIM